MIILDVETTGQDYDKHSFFSLAAIDFNNLENQFNEECQLFEGAEIDPEALAYNQVPKESILDPNKQTQRQLLEKFLTWLETVEDNTICGINVFFDFYFIEKALARENLPSPLTFRIVDLHTLIYAHHIKRNTPIPIKNQRTDIKSSKIMGYVGLPVEPFPHIAINGVLWETEVFSRLTLGKNLLKQFEQYPIPDYLLKN